MLTPTYLEHVPDEMAALWQMVEDDILRDVARRIKANTGLTATADWQLHKLEEMRLLQNSITKTLAKYSGINGQTLRSVLKRAGFDSLAGDKKYYEAMGITPGDPNKSEILLNLLTAGYEQTAGTWKNLTQTTARTVTGQFEAAMDRAQLQVQSGAFDYQTAVRRACDTLGSDMKFVEYPSGHRDTLEVAVRRAVLTGVNQTAGKLQTARMDEYGIDFVETTAHMGARPSHAEWQGKVFHRGGQIEYKGKMYRDFVEATRYGYGDGLCGWNCRHNFYPFIPGLSEPAYDQKELERLNARDQLYRGKLYTEYEMSQMQRALERKVRAAKKDFILAEEAGFDPHYAAVKYNNSLDRLRDFCNETGRRMDSSRTSVTGFSSEERRRALRAARAANPTLPKPPRKTASTPKVVNATWTPEEIARLRTQSYEAASKLREKERALKGAESTLRGTERYLKTLAKPQKSSAELGAEIDALEKDISSLYQQYRDVASVQRPNRSDYVRLSDGDMPPEYYADLERYRKAKEEERSIYARIVEAESQRDDLTVARRAAINYESMQSRYQSELDAVNVARNEVEATRAATDTVLHGYKEAVIGTGAQITENECQKVAAGKKTTAAEVQEIIDTLNACENEQTRFALIKYLDAVNAYYGGESGVYKGGANSVYWNTNKAQNHSDMAKYGTFFHEVHHALDRLGAYDGLTYGEMNGVRQAVGAIVDLEASNSDQFLGAVRKDREYLNGIGFDTLKKDLFPHNASNGVQDAIDGMFAGANNYILWGHGEKYYNRWYNIWVDDSDKRNSLKTLYQDLGLTYSTPKTIARTYETASEMWANIGSAEVCGGAELEYIKKYLPNSYAAYQEIMKGVK